MTFSDNRFAEHGFGKSYAWIDFVNSEEFNGFGVRSDHLHDASWRRAFLRRWALGPSFGEQSNVRDLTRARALLRSAAEAIAAGKGLSKRDLKRMNSALRSPAYRVLEKRKGQAFAVEIVPIRRNWTWMQAELIASLGRMLSEGQRHRLKICPNPGCRWLFFDQTRGNTRKWCSDLTCGNRDKVRRYRAQKVAREKQR